MEEELDGTQRRPSAQKPMAAGTPSRDKMQHLQLERPDIMVEGPVTDTEDDQVDMEFTVMPPSPQVSHANSQQAIAEEVNTDGAKHPQYQDNQWLNRHSPAQEDYITMANKVVRVNANPVFSDKQSIVSGEDSIHEGVVYNANQPLYARGKAHEIPSGGHVYTYRNDSGVPKNPNIDGFHPSSGFNDLGWEFEPDNVPIYRRPVASG
ncbi:unnamed protein product [Dibothriocephalus latus]|uniref:Uncharacterized protein n=1 Tax=Dibothriocephalus latus TaxID=60516 RepID=A0A3P7LJ60_DIBLA|nr:unnamed protein product [Dibothriocephalus latus]